MPILPATTPAAPPRTDVADLLAHRDQAYRLSLRLLGNAADAEDAVQHAYLQALRFGGERPSGEAGRRWFLAVVANAARRLRNRRGRRAEREQRGVEPPAPEPTPATERSPALLRAVDEALAGLRHRRARAVRGREAGCSRS